MINLLNDYPIQASDTKTLQKLKKFTTDPQFKPSELYKNAFENGGKYWHYKLLISLCVWCFAVEKYD